MPVLKIVDERPADLNEVHALLQAAGLSIEGVAEGIAGFLIAREDGRVVAVAGLEDHGMVGLLRSVTVAADQRNRGLAGTLVRTLIDRSRARGHEALYLLTDTAQEYFARFGFARIERAAVRPALLGSQQFRSETCESSAVMVLEFAGRNGFDENPSDEED